MVKPLLFTNRLLLGAGLLTWAVVGYPRVSGLAALPSRLTQPAGIVWLVAFLTFGVTFWLNAREERSGRGSVLGVQTAAALGVLATSHSGFEGALLAVIAGQAPQVLPPRIAFLWTAGLFLPCEGA